jgi:hypothetical protein
VDGYSAIAPKRVTKNSHKSKEKQVGMAIINMSDVITTQDMKPQLDFDISTKQYNILKSPIACARHTGASNKKSIR